MENRYAVYWIKSNEHEDIRSQGYVGISCNPRRRFRQHAKGDRIIGRAIKKHDIEDFVIVHENVSFEEAKTIEKELRPCSNIGWNVAPGGQTPPFPKGTKRPSQSERMRGSNNHFYGKTHDEATRQLISELKRGENHPFYGQKRPDHSQKMKTKKGKNYPKFRGYFITPHGEYSSYKTACDETGITVSSLYSYCVVDNEKIVSLLSYRKSKILKELFTEEQAVGKTYRSLGFGFRHE